MTIIQTAKELLKKGIALNDPELIEMANKLIEVNSVESIAVVESPEPQIKQKSTKKKSVAKKEKAQEFVATWNTNKNNARKVSVAEVSSPRINLWIDDGTQAKDEENITPLAPRAKRDRPPTQKVKQVCDQCNQSYMVHPTHVREVYVCDECLSNRRKGRR